MGKQNKYERRLRTIMHQKGHLVNPSYGVIKGYSVPEFRKRISSLCKDYKEMMANNPRSTDNAWFKKEADLVIELDKLVKDHNISDEELLKVWKQTNYKKALSRIILSRNTLKETRDNKDVHVGNGGSNANKIRYPSMKRSKATWKRFYKLFPNAERRVKV